MQYEHLASLAATADADDIKHVLERIAENARRGTGAMFLPEEVKYLAGIIEAFERFASNAIQEAKARARASTKKVKPLTRGQRRLLASIAENPGRAVSNGHLQRSLRGLSDRGLVTAAAKGGLELTDEGKRAHANGRFYGRG